MASQTYRAAVNARLDEASFTEGGNTFYTRTGSVLESSTGLRKPVPISAVWRSLASVNLVFLADTLDRLLNMSSSATGHRLTSQSIEYVI